MRKDEKKLFVALAILVAALVLAACGGGGDDQAHAADRQLVAEQPATEEVHGPPIPNLTIEEITVVAAEDAAANRCDGPAGWTRWDDQEGVVGTYCGWYHNDWHKFSTDDGGVTWIP